MIGIVEENQTRYVGRPCRKCGGRQRHRANRMCVGCLRENNRRWKQQGRGRAAAILNGLRRRGPVCTLTLDDVDRLLQRTACSYCGRETRAGGAAGRDLQTIDKLLPALGYVPGNVVVACGGCNTRKSDQTPEEMRAMASRVEALVAREATGVSQ